MEFKIPWSKCIVLFLTSRMGSKQDKLYLQITSSLSLRYRDINSKDQEMTATTRKSTYLIKSLISNILFSRMLYAYFTLLFSDFAKMRKWRRLNLSQSALSQTLVIHVTSLNYTWLTHQWLFYEHYRKISILTVIPKSHPILLFTSLQIRWIDAGLLAWLFFLFGGLHSQGRVPSVRWSSCGLL